jgi:phosphatidylglycerol:prolipoprotein diacylglycerol transferase
MYPNLYYAFKDLFNIELGFLHFVNSFGFFVAISFLTAAYLLYKELERKEKEGRMGFTTQKVVIGKPASTTELVINFIWGFLFGYKIIGLFIADKSQVADPQAFIFSMQGNLLTGLIAGAIFAYTKYAEKKKQALPSPKEEMRKVWPKDRVGDMLMLAALFGFLGAKLFHNFENWDEFVQDPIGSLFSFSGLTFYGGLICAGIAIYYYSRKHKFSFRELCDAIAPALIIAYAIGRIGCQVSGDGDWGIVNAAYVNTPDGKVVKADSATAMASIEKNINYYYRQFRDTSAVQVQKKFVEAPSFLPTWMVAYNFPNNVISEGVKLEGCEGEQYCSQLPMPVFPTAFYETIMGFIIFLILWAIRKRVKIAGMLFAIYLILNGLERFTIEKIRVNNKMHLLGFNPTQAEVISLSLVVIGLVLAFVLWKRKDQNVTATKK